jgi:signal transduction histidine kinase
MPSFEESVRELCAKIVACPTEEETIHLARQLHALIHQHMEETRRVATLSFIKNRPDPEAA